MNTTVTLTAAWATCSLPRIQASTPVEMYGPVTPIPEIKLIAEHRAPEGTRYCEELNAYVPADLQYRIRGIPVAKETRKKTFVERLFKRQSKDEGEPLVMAMGLTHGKMGLISLGEAQSRAAIVYRGVAA
ncbi:hypothetical protein PHLCEN_2v9795 [Hermanssonia centrifuga]|uniref:Uncharacterized protein n=1 Tax=Hermanssonia centrifuga TaxID=98765 RepID=A0A2R6NPR3_9APHY|nr:hypothetical protein PHLCEN_2v9795 [Hermanssonia centrifuga]